MKLKHLIIGIIMIWHISTISSECQVVNVSEIQFKPGTIENYDSGEFKSGKLAETTKILEFTCKNILELHKDGKLKQCRLAEENQFNDIKFPKNTVLFFAEDDTLEYCWLGKSIVIQGIPCKGGQQTQTSFHKNGKIQCCYLSRASKIEGILCRAALNAPVCFFPDGRLKECTVDADQKIKGKFVKEGSKLLF